MPLSESTGDTRWLTLTQAARQLGVHAATLRRWADNGEIAVMFTPGGHRRFAFADIERFAQQRRQEPQSLPVATTTDVWAERALARTRQDLGGQEQTWLATIDDTSRLRHRALGRRLMGLTLQYISAEPAPEALLEEARLLGHEYGHLSQSTGMSLTESLEASMFFRDTLVETALQMPASTRIQPEANLRLMRRINHLLNTVHLAIAETYDD